MANMSHELRYGQSATPSGGRTDLISYTEPDAEHTRLPTLYQDYIRRIPITVHYSGLTDIGELETVGCESCSGETGSCSHCSSAIFMTTPAYVEMVNNIGVLVNAYLRVNTKRMDSDLTVDFLVMSSTPSVTLRKWLLDQIEHNIKHRALRTNNVDDYVNAKSKFWIDLHQRAKGITDMYTIDLVEGFTKDPSDITIFGESHIPVTEDRPRTGTMTLIRKMALNVALKITRDPTNTKYHRNIITNYAAMKYLVDWLNVSFRKSVYEGKMNYNTIDGQFGSGNTPYVRKLPEILNKLESYRSQS